MSKIEFPDPLKRLLEDSPLLAPIRALADSVGIILADNKLPFFPDYTDHGTDHVNRVLETEVDLVPPEVWENSQKHSKPRLLCDVDATVLIGATLLHDFAMHLKPEGLIELVSESTRFKPISWFDKEQGARPADRPWPDLWADYLREAKRFSDRDLTNIIGEEDALTWKFDGLPSNTGEWTTNDCLVIGEFVRRHHARLAHEIAMHGFPGLPQGAGKDEFPAMGEKGHPLQNYADLIGVSARSHGMSMRLCKDYLKWRYPKAIRQMGAAALYPMALLRVADYLQIDCQRAPSVLLQLRNPQSPISIREWQKHLAVRDIGPGDDPRAKIVSVNEGVRLSIYLQLRDLVSGLQEEIDHSTAVLDET